ncbi:MAG TPA: cytochrome c oxidase assembly protein [Actinomycetota bacterium]|nr:cytochrome c oxidase assembly protein [Actinomycetota bacterium]
MTLAQAASAGLDWHPHLEVWAIVGGAALAYRYAVRTLGPRYAPPGEQVVTRRHVTWFTLGLATLWLASDWPVHELAEGYLYSVHMVQHMLISLVAPPLLMMGMPAWMWRLVLGSGRLLGLVRRITRPLLALVVYNAVLVLTHMPSLVDISVRSEPVHFGVHLLVFTSSLVMWTPVLSPIIELPALSYPGRCFYLFLQSLVPTVPASFLTFGDGVIYRFYETTPRIIALSPLDDQRTAGLIMKLGGGFLLWGVITVLFFKWFTAEQRDGWDALSYRDVEATVRTRIMSGGRNET